RSISTRMSVWCAKDRFIERNAAWLEWANRFLHVVRRCGLTFGYEGETTMIRRFDLARYLAQPIPWRSCIRGLFLFIALSSVSLLNICHAAAASSQVVHRCAHAMASAACECTSATGSGSSGATVQIDEDWELVITEPDPDLAAPQIQTVMSPFQDV